jgi:hypothetical protein
VTAAQRAAVQAAMQIASRLDCSICGWGARSRRSWAFAG